jgi:hypothetical protein
MAPDRTAYRAAIAQVAATAHAKLPECTGRIDSAVKLVLLGEVTLHADGTATVGSCTDPTRTYTVNGRCDCQDFARAPGQLCKHRLAYGIARRAAELTPPTPEVGTDTQDQPPGQPVPALPEAPASANCYILIAGRQVQLTLRDTDETRLLERLATVLRQYPDLPSPHDKKAIKTSGETSDTGQPGWCQIHNVAMQENHKDGRTWSSHKMADGQWCKGRPRR